MSKIKIKKFPKPISERICTRCNNKVRASRFCLMANDYQAWGWCKCGVAHSFEEYIPLRWWIDE